jgi:hypothetical protein
VGVRREALDRRLGDDCEPDLLVEVTDGAVEAVDDRGTDRAWDLQREALSS